MYLKLFYAIFVECGNRFPLKQYSLDVTSLILRFCSLVNGEGGFLQENCREVERFY